MIIPRTWTPERDQTLTDFHAQLLFGRDIAGRMGITEKAVYSRTRRLGLQPRRSIPKLSGVSLRWTEAQIETLRAMWPTSRAVEIAAALGPTVTKNSVIGKAHRLGLEVKGHSGPRVSSGRPRTQRVVRAASADTAAPAMVPLILSMLRGTHCRELISGLELYCGLPKDRGSYCAHHANINYRQS